MAAPDTAPVERLLDAVLQRDFAGCSSCLAADVSFKALLPDASHDVVTAREAAWLLAHWFDDATQVEVVDRIVDTIVDRVMKRRYLWALNWVLNHRILTLSILVGLLIFTATLLPGLGGEFMPQLEEGNLWIRATLPRTVSFENASSFAFWSAGVERRVASWTTASGVSAATNLAMSANEVTSTSIGEIARAEGLQSFFVAFCGSGTTR